jgi:hypothetical protein
MRPIILVCVAVYAAAMEAVNLAAHQLVAQFGFTGAVLTVAAMWGTARYFERARR